MKNKLIILSSGIFIVLLSCTTTKKTIITEKKIVKQVQKEMLYEVITEENYGGKEQKSNVIIKNKEDLKALNKEVSLNKQIIKLDFNKSNLVILFMGQKNSGGYSIGVESVTEYDDTIHVKIKETEPKEGEVAIMALTSPYCIVKINSKKNIVFD